MPQEPKADPGASVVQPVTAAEVQATEAFLAWVQALRDWGQTSAQRAALAKDQACR